MYESIVFCSAYTMSSVRKFTFAMSSPDEFLVCITDRLAWHVIKRQCFCIYICSFSTKLLSIFLQQHGCYARWPYLSSQDSSMTKFVDLGTKNCEKRLCAVRTDTHYYFKYSYFKKLDFSSLLLAYLPTSNFILLSIRVAYWTRFALRMSSLGLRL